MKARDDLQKENDEKSKKIADLEDVEVNLRQDIAQKESAITLLQQEKTDLQKDL